MEGAGGRRGDPRRYSARRSDREISASSRATTRYTRIRQTGSGPSSVLYDQVEVSHYNDPPEGIVCENLPETAKVRFGLFTGKLRLADCGRADIFALIHYGVAIIDGAEQPKTGFTG